MNGAFDYLWRKQMIFVSQKNGKFETRDQAIWTGTQAGEDDKIPRGNV